MHVIPIAGCDPTSLCRFCLVLVLVVFPVFAVLFLVCFLVLLFSCWDCFWTAYCSTTGTFVAFNKVTALHVNYNSTVCRDWMCVTTWRKPWRRWTEKKRSWSRWRVSLASCSGADIFLGTVSSPSAADLKRWIKRVWLSKRTRLTTTKSAMVATTPGLIFSGGTSLDQMQLFLDL